ncbi:MAG: putative DNA binding domain-containing protein [Phycisphaerales bacterium]|nr:putative DNA binding domain-containing protein [Phycisphaerales bacterium]
MDEQKLQTLIQSGESLTVEFKSDRQQIGDAVIYEEVVAMANTKGGTLLIGVEDDGTITGAKPRHSTSTDPTKLQAAIFNNTVPNVNTRISVVRHPKGPVIVIEVDIYPEPCATTGGKSVRRTIGGDGKPHTVPYYPRDQRSRRTDMGLLDFSAQVVEDATMDSLDPLEFERLRQTISRLHGDQSLLQLSDGELAKALRLVETQSDGRTIPNIAGLLLLGREAAIQSLLPTHQLHFQVLDVQGNVKVNDVFALPLIRVLAEVDSRFAARNEEREVLMGMFRLPVPDYSPDGFREAVNNAMLHRDYTRLDDIYIQWQPDHLLITSPGGLPEGVTLDNLLVHEPKPRNPRLAEAFRRIGLVEQTGRGIDKIFAGQLRYGRAAPNYGRSDATAVRVVLRGGQPSLQFAAFVYEQDKAGTPLSLDEMLVLNTLFFERRIDTERAENLIQKGTTEARAVLEQLHERGMVEARGEKRGRVYHLAASLYRQLGQIPAYVRSRGFDQIQQRQMILNFVQMEGQITRAKAAELCQISGLQASYLLRKMCDFNELEKAGKGRRYIFYRLANARV